MKNKKFYITTPIYYPSGQLHIGHVYTTTMADVLSRYKKMMGYETFFLTGSDEHGQKIEKKATEMGLPPKKYVDEVVKKFKNLWNEIDIDYSKFIRTTDDYHEKTIQKIFSILLEKDLVYLSKYKGFYCVSCEEFLTAQQIKDGLCIVSKDKPKVSEEETYMLRVSKFEKYLENLFESDFLIPKSRRTEMLKNFVNNNLEDLSVTRVSFKWGVPIRENPNHIIYVWIDALSNYITALGYLQENDINFKKFWANDCEIVQLVGKEITRFHSIYWPIILKSLDLRLPNHLISHGWVMSKGLKMSKSIGNVVDPIELINEFGSDTLRFYVINNLSYDTDGDITTELIKEAFNTYLANNYGNLLSRVSNMIILNKNGLLDNVNLNKSNIYCELLKTIKYYKIEMNKYNLNNASKIIFSFSSMCNKYIEDSKPWEMKKNGKDKKINFMLYELQYAIVGITLMLKPILVKSFNQACHDIGINNNTSFEDIENQNLKFKKIIEKNILFKRIK